MPLDSPLTRRLLVKGFAKILRAGALEVAMAARPRLVLNVGFLPPGVTPTRDALGSATIECERAGQVQGSLCLDCPRLVFWMVAPERDRLKLFCRRDPGQGKKR
jgi:hypothetical protein